MPPFLLSSACRLVIGSKRSAFSLAVIITATIVSTKPAVSTPLTVSANLTLSQYTTHCHCQQENTAPSLPQILLPNTKILN